MITHKIRSFKSFSVLLCALGVLGFAAVASAQALERTLHEYFQTPTSYESLSQVSSASVDRPAASTTQPPRMPSRDPGEPPPLTLSASEDEPLVNQDGPRSTRPMENPQGGLDPLSAQNKLDDNTDRVDELDYYSSFDPSVIPFKRLVSQNVVRYTSGQYVFAVDPRNTTNVPIVNKEPQSTEDVFWGTFLVKAAPGVSLPIASVAPNQRILEAQTEPPADVEISRDAAGNYSMIVNTQGLTRVNLKIAVPRSYFIGDFEPTSWSRLDRSMVIDLPDEAQRQAWRVLSYMNLSRADKPHRVLMELIGYFRAFEGRSFPQDLRGDDLYYSIASNKIGVCRHRSFAFVITASAIGIPTRYVYNEAHAFVEVHWPGVGWRRVDLGGAAQDVLMRSQNDGRVHDTGAPDQLPQPEAYVQEMDRMAQQEEQRRDNAGTGTGTGNGDNGGLDFEDGPMNTIDNGQGDPSNTGDPGDPSDGTDDGQGSPGSDEEKFFDGDDYAKDERTPSTIMLVDPPAQLERGGTFTLTGKLATLTDVALGQKKVRVMLSPHQSRSSRQSRTLGEVTTDINGNFSAELRVPMDLSIGRWSLTAVFDGDDEYRAYTSN